VAELIGNRFRNTVVLATAAALVGIPLAIVLGVIAGLMRDKWPDVLVSTTSIVGMTLPGFVTATILIFVFAICPRSGIIAHHRFTHYHPNPDHGRPYITLGSYQHDRCDDK
jgi:ABC-type dipeptide/oligopeptide/nickel transport system permease component